MRSKLSVFVLGICVWLPAAAALAAPAPLEAFFELHCYDCHSGEKPDAGLDLATLPRDFSAPGTVARFVRIHDRIAGGEMPPAASERPTAGEIKSVTSWLDGELTKADDARIARDGRSRMRRMTVAEFENSLRDILALEKLDVRDFLPEDTPTFGFTKVADNLDLSPVHMDACATAVEHALTAAIATRSTPPPVLTGPYFPSAQGGFFGQMTQGSAVLLKDFAIDPLLPLVREQPVRESGSLDELRARNAVRRKQRLADVEASGVRNSESAVGLLGHPLGGEGGWVAFNVAPLFAGRHRIRLSTWGFEWDKGVVKPIEAGQAAVLWAFGSKGRKNGRQLAMLTAPSLAPRVHEIEAWVDVGEKLEFDPVSLDSKARQRKGGTLFDYVGPGVAVDWFEVTGPIHDIWPPESHRRLFGDLPLAPLTDGTKATPPFRETVTQEYGHIPAPLKDLSREERSRPLETVQSTDPEADARRLLAAFLPRAFRRPIEPAEVEPYVSLVLERLRLHDCFEDAMRRAYVAVLTSPDFLFIPADNERGDHSLATRLSYWLHNSPPDAELLAAARDGTLAQPAVFQAQIDRLLADPRSDRFITDFTDQWLELARIDETTPDAELYPEFSYLLQEGMVAETRAFVRELIAKDLPIKTLATADFAMLTARLAEHYGVPGVEGAEVRRVAVPAGSHRGGLLSQAAILKLTANGTVTSPVKRGVWVLDRLLADPPPPPPPSVPAVDPDTRGATTIREQLALHRKSAACATCHVKIDPAGFAMESFDPIGGYRDRYRSTGAGGPPPRDALAYGKPRYRIGPAVDSSGELADGRRFTGIDELKRLIAADDERLARAFVVQLSRYATGADVRFADRKTIENILAATRPSGYGVRSLIHAVADSPLLRRP
jgi:hypothetical protein